MDNLEPYSYILPFISLIYLVLKFSPVTTFTANQFEKKLYTKERRFSIKFINFILQSIIISIFLMALSEYTKDINDNLIIGYIIIVFIIFAFLAYKAEAYKKGDRSSRKVTVLIWKLILTFTYLVLLLVIFSSIIGGIHDVEIGDNINEKIAYMSAFFIGSYLYSVIITIFISPLDKFLSWSDKEAAVYIKSGPDNEEIWYILHPISKQEILLGDDKYDANCKKFKKILKEDLLYETVFKE
ncbi:hypothetical protein CEY16_05490 [Halalkalibacillus sediminis]|uniref:Uncharacterized protein n=1 Tax=Halalkalibacillus sediminis TaxID=2018042 RepID=A0A2I0QXZ0_9BACI|nr:hypothetical protein [Halalkalibacillus sediminis]PKR79197.1 hypothetical protein CEY16_05490 [Halalkalibacillus sediminis]